MVVYKKSPLVEFIRTSSKGDVLKLRRAMKYIFGYKSLTVPKGFSCDGMSVPRFLWSIISPTIHPETIAASIGHDYLYQHGSSKGWSRWQADLFFYCVLRCDGVSVWRAAAAFAGVRIFGAQYYKKQGSK